MNSVDRSQADQMSFFELCAVIWNGKWIIASITFLAALGAAAYGLLADEWYRVEVLLAPAQGVGSDVSNTLGGLGGLVGLAGLGLGDGVDPEAVAILRSRAFARSVIEELELQDVLLPPSTGAKSRNGHTDIRDAVTFFIERVRKVTEDSRTGHVTLSVEWKDPELAAMWARTMVDRVNEYTRDRALAEAEANVEFLQDTLSRTNVTTLRQSVANLLEGELQKLMLAKGQGEFAFRIIDGPEVPKYRARPKRTLIVLIVVMGASILSSALVVVIHVARDTQR